MLALDDVVRETGGFAGTATAGIDDGPGVLVTTVTGDRSGDLRAGDRILTVRHVDVRTARSRNDWKQALALAGRGGDEVPVRYLRGGAERETRITLTSHRQYWPRLIASLAFATCAVILGFAGRGATLPMLFSATYFATAVLMTVIFTGGLLESHIASIAHWVSMSLVGPLTLLTFLHLDDSRRLRIVDHVWPWAFAAFAPLDVSRFSGRPLPPGTASVLLGALSAVFFVACIWLLVRAYRRASPVGRRRLRWILLGVYVALFTGTLPQLLAAFDPSWSRTTVITLSGIGVLPICVLLGVLRHDFLDIDRVWTVVLASSLMLAGIFVGGETIVPVFSSGLQEASGTSEEAATGFAFIVVVAATVPLVAALLFLARRAFLSDQLQVRQGIAQLVNDLSGLPSDAHLARRATDEIARLFDPSFCTTYLREDDALVPAAHRGAGTPGRVLATGPLAAALEEASEPISLARETRALGRLGTFQRAALETLDAAVAVPCTADGALAGFIVLGPRRSGDTYTPTDETLLRLIADKLTSELRALRQKARLDAIEPFLPAGVTARTGRTEASVLFVDIRGFTGLADGLALDELRELVASYSAAAASVITAHGGHVYSWHGDELMGLFGPWESLADKEKAAVDAARATIQTLARLEREGGPLSVGVGIATGEIYLDEVSAANRRFSAALGRTTNLASKLQGLTREIDAAIAIDRVTWQRSGASDAFLPYLNRNIPGLPESQDVFVLPLERATAGRGRGPR